MKIQTPVLALGFGLSLSALAHAACDVDPLGSVERARQEEAKCMSEKEISPRNECLDGITEWWFECGGDHVDYNPYTEITRVLEIQLASEPTRLEAISNLAYFIYSIEVEEILAGTRADFTHAAMDAFVKRESYFEGKFQFYNMALDPSLVIVGHGNAKLETRKAYYAHLKRMSAKAHELWATMDRSQLSAQEINDIELQLRVARKALAKHQAALDQ